MQTNVPEITKATGNGYSIPATSANQIMDEPVTNSHDRIFNQSESSKMIEQSDWTPELNIGAKDEMK